MTFWVRKWESSITGCQQVCRVVFYWQLWRASWFVIIWKWAETLNVSTDYLCLSKIFVNKVSSRNTSIKAVSTWQISSLCCLPALSFSPLSFSSPPLDWHPYFNELPRGCLPVSRGFSLITEALSSSNARFQAEDLQFIRLKWKIGWITCWFFAMNWSPNGKGWRRTWFPNGTNE